MKRIICAFAAIFFLACPSLASRAPLERAYIATHGHLNEFLISPSGLMFPVGYKGLPKNFGSWTLSSNVSIPTLKQAGSVVATPNGKYLYVAGCARDRTRVVHGSHPMLEEIAAYQIVGGIPRILGAPTQIDDCLTGNQGPYQTLVVSHNGSYLYATGGVRYDDAANQESTTIRSFSIAQNGMLTPITTLSVSGFPLSAYTALDSTGKWLFVAGIVARYKAPLTLTEIHVGVDGSLTLGTSTSFAGQLDAFSGLASSARFPQLYAAGEKISSTGAMKIRLLGFRIGLDGALTPVPGPAMVDTGLSPTDQPNYASL
ncbi:MAG: hypothetical protein ACYDA1_04225, partial [Vulcanimicrobiaceae bacterium]